MPLPIVRPFPLRSQGLDQGEYSLGVENALSDIPPFIEALNEIGSAYALSTNGTSTSSVLIGTGSKSFTTQLNLGYKVGMTLRIANTSTAYMTGEVTSYNTGTGALVINITSTAGAGTLASWVISMGAVGDLTSKASLSGATFTGDIIVPDEAYDQSAWNGNLEAPTKSAVRDKIESLSKSIIFPIDSSVSANALTLTLNPTLLDFRSATLTSGTITTRTVASAISLVVPSTATLGTVNAISARLAILAIDNAGTVELAVTNIAGGLNLDESGVISTTALSTGSDSANVIYSTTARSNVAYRVVGFVDISETTAGTWATDATVKQGSGGQALTSLASFGFGQAWRVVSRASGTTYYNTTNKPIMISVTAVWTSASIVVQGVTISIPGTTQSIPIGFIVPPYQSYVFTTVGALRIVAEMSQ